MKHFYFYFPCFAYLLKRGQLTTFRRATFSKEENRNSCKFIQCFFAGKWEEVFLRAGAFISINTDDNFRI